MLTNHYTEALTTKLIEARDELKLCQSINSELMTDEAKAWKDARIFIATQTILTIEQELNELS